MERVRETFERAWRGVIAPNKYSYNINTVCPKQQYVEGQLIERIDFNVLNDEGKNISAVILKQKHKNPKEAVLYFHGNGGTKVEIMNILPLIVEHSIALISFDFIGCGNSDQGYLTYGLNEVTDAEIVLREAYKYLEIDRLAVWGRSMGAVTAINFAVKNPKIVSKLVLDSPFRNLQMVIRRVIKQETSIPQPFVSIIFYFLRKEIEQRLKFPLFSEDYLLLFKRLPKQISVLVICSENDTIVPKEEVEEFYRAFKGDRQLLQISQSHQQDRGLPVYEDVLRWIKRQKTRKNLKLRLYRPLETLNCEEEQVYTIC